MMLEEQLQKHKILSFAGAFSINRKSRDLLNSLNYAAEILTDPDNLLCVFPQGEFQNQYEKKLKFYRGFLKILNPEVQVVFATTCIEYFASKKPAVYIYLKCYSGLHEEERIEEAFQKHYEESVGKNRVKF